MSSAGSPDQQASSPRADRDQAVLVLNLLLIGLAISLEPIPLHAFNLVLASKNGGRFIFGWLCRSRW